MYIIVMFGDGCWELVNPWCNMVTFSTHLKQKGKVPLDATIALLGVDGYLVSLDNKLEKEPFSACTMDSLLLQERGTYVLVQIIKGKGGTPTHYKSLLENLDDWSPELAELLHNLSKQSSLETGYKKHTHTHSGRQEQVLTSRSRKGGFPATQDPIDGGRSQKTSLK